MPGEPPRVPRAGGRPTGRMRTTWPEGRARRGVGHRHRTAVRAYARQTGQEAPEGEYLFEPKWDGFRSLIWRSGDMVEIGSRNSRPMTRYFPELVEAIIANFPDHSVIDGEIVMVDPELGDRLNFDALQQRIHPAASRIAKLSRSMPASFVAFDLLAIGRDNYAERPFRERRVALEEALAGPGRPSI
ncbi:ATP-dependent DNA ligase [Tessaracoccus coleopterorum]|uniref:ATP-dependent DNA ligase n=1 Tax=Tessaracoccus coleopterorum TaxID=2714950 RepID=UPI002F911A86